MVVGVRLAAGGLAVGFPVEDWKVKRENRARNHRYRGGGERGGCLKFERGERWSEDELEY